MRSQTARSTSSVPTATPAEDTIPMGNVRVSPPRKRLVPVLDVAGSTACGPIRDSNQDQYAIVELQRRELIARAAICGGSDNTTVIVARITAEVAA